MAFPPRPEVATYWGGLDDAAVDPDRPGSATHVRELIRNGNLAKAEPDLMFRYMADADLTITEARQQAARGFAWPFWFDLIPMAGGIPVPDKKPGLKLMSSDVIFELTSDKALQIQIETMARPHDDNLPESELQILTGAGIDVGADSTESKEDWPIHEGRGEVLRIRARGVVDPDTDTPLATATYNGAASGTVTSAEPAAGLFFDSALVTPWKTASPMVHEGGHYVVFKSPQDGRIVHGPFIIVDTYQDRTLNGKGLFFWPALESVFAWDMAGLTYEIYQLSEYRLISFACYSKELAP